MLGDQNVSSSPLLISVLVTPPQMLIGAHVAEDWSAIARIGHDKLPVEFLRKRERESSFRARRSSIARA